MNTHLVTLERELARLARDFAHELVKAALRATISELPVLRESATLLQPESFPVSVSEIVRDAGARAATPRRQGTRGAPSRAPHVPRAASPSARRRETHAPRPQVRPRAEVDDVDDAEVGANTITDPSLLLEVIAAGSEQSRRPQRERASVLLASRDGAPKERVKERERDADQGPALRPGERLQRTAGGNVVLRRGRS